jgi:hypothetical protein
MSLLHPGVMLRMLRMLHFLREVVLRNGSGTPV